MKRCPSDLFSQLSISHEETNAPLHADRRNFYKVERSSRDGQLIEEMLVAGNSAEQLLAVVPLADFIIFRNYVSVTEGMQEPA
jgi:hypothetical protein